LAEHGLNSSLKVVVRRDGKREKFVSLLLLFILLTAATAGVFAVLTGPDWISLWESLLFGMLIGWVLAIFRWGAWRSALLVIIIGILLSLLFAGGLNVRLLAVLDEFFKLVGGIIPSIKSREVDLTPLVNSLQQVLTSASIVLGRVFSWLKDLLTGKPVYDPVAANLVWGIVVWLVAAWAGWMVEAGRNALIAVLPALVLNLSILSYGRSNSITIYILLATTLVLIAVVQYNRHEQEWQATKIAYPRRKGRQVGNTSLLIAIGLVLLAAFISSLSISRALNWISEHNRPVPQQESGLAKSLGIQQASAPPDAFSAARSPGLPRQLLIGSGPELSKEMVMTMQVKDLTSLVQNGQLPPLYWRSFTYDIYTGHGWSTSPTTQETYQSDQPIQSSQLPDHILIDEIVRPVPGEAGTIYASGEPVSVNLSSSVAWRSSNDLFGLQSTDEGYEVQSLIPQVSEANLRLAGQAYPEWVTRRYLALPEEVSTRVRELALQLTATEPTPYDRARAIEQYLRSTYPYTTDVPRPPANQDLADFFLFDLRKGYCDYYASAMVVLARAAGIPARLVIGYATGEYNLNSQRFVVSQADAHSWVEVYFPGIGWVTFEPTASLPEINYSAQPTQVATPTAVPPQAAQSQGPLNTASYLGYGLLILPVLAGLIWAVYDEIHLRQLNPRHAAKEIYRRMRRYGKLFDVLSEAGETPYEFVVALSWRVQAYTAGQDRFTSELIRQVQTIINQIVRLSYRPVEAESVLSRQILSRWRALRWRFRWMWVLKIQQSWRVKRASGMADAFTTSSRVK
jgi:transglutaminase-like putative cysteine protease/uncharacterized membrane protein YidH (DUF202 family)